MQANHQISTLEPSGECLTASDVAGCERHVGIQAVGTSAARSYDILGVQLEPHTRNAQLAVQLPRQHPSPCPDVDDPSHARGAEVFADNAREAQHLLSLAPGHTPKPISLGRCWRGGGHSTFQLVHALHEVKQRGRWCRECPGRRAALEQHSKSVCRRHANLVVREAEQERRPRRLEPRRSLREALAHAPREQALVEGGDERGSEREQAGWRACTWKKTGPELPGC
mmetsp:Transcript_139523/g.445266  ORF Transcript_139523/g.445266 Transcript_139523/m.445266 type:complete len:226 (+) Transcript_139523:252-929(+)